MRAPGQSGLVPTGRVNLDWHVTDGGLGGAASTFQDGDIYALSTGPGVREEDHPDGTVDNNCARSRMWIGPYQTGNPSGLHYGDVPPDGPAERQPRIVPDLRDLTVRGEARVR